MKSAVIATKAKEQMPMIARAGLIAKGVVYVLLGVFVLLSALHIRRQTSGSSKTGALKALDDSIVGRWLLLFISVGLLCYSIWRFYEGYQSVKHLESKWEKAARYFFSGIIYLFVGYSAVKMFLRKYTDSGNSEQHFAATLLSKPFGQWLLGIAAMVIAAVGIYQVFYGIAGKYKNHVQKMSLHSAKAKLLLTSGIVGYVARGIVWLIISYLMLKAAIMKSATKAGATDKAFDFVETVWGANYLALMAGGLIAYGLFNFVRSRYERF
ncbi:MAG TPA: DUF1206 domain-containing protein [Flavitalea sp.]|nr:DUF1206 domain-containing protein [Flavitalea sp.]